jgi:hypothetical protein
LSQRYHCCFPPPSQSGFVMGYLTWHQSPYNSGHSRQGCFQHHCSLRNDLATFVRVSCHKLMGFG